MSRLPEWFDHFQVEVPFTETTVAIYAGRSGRNAIVNFRDSSATVRLATTYRPRPGEPVTLVWTDGVLRLTGPARAHSSTGTIKTLGNPYVVVTCDEIDYRLPFAVSLAGQLQVGNKVELSWEGTAYVKDKLSADAADPDQPPKLTVDQAPFTLNVFAKDSGSFWEEKWRSRDVIAKRGGAWFYGTTLRKSLRNDALITSVEIWLPLRSTEGGLSRIGKHSEADRPNGDVSLSDLGTRKDRSGWVSLPVAWANTWRSNDGGVGISGGGENVYKGIQADRQSGKLRIKGRQ